MRLHSFHQKARLTAASAIDQLRNILAKSADGTVTQQLDLSELEDRILLSASPAAVVVESISSGDSAETTAPLETRSDSLFETVQLATPAAGSGEDELGSVAAQGLLALDSELDESAAQTSAPIETVATEVIFIDEAAEDFEQLVADLVSQRDAGRAIDYVVLDSQRDGIDQIAETLSRYSDLDAVHIVSHGTGGAVKLGATWLRIGSLDGYAGTIAGWGSAISTEGDILFYGCDLASNSRGEMLVDSVSALTGADVAASTNDTGHAIFAGDWDLEYQTGTIEAQIAVTEELQNSWGHLLNVTIDATSTGTTPSFAASDTVSHTTSGTDRLMLVGISFGQDKGDTVSSVTYNGANLTLVGSQDNSVVLGARMEIWSLVAPDIGTHDVVVNFSGTNHIGATIGVMTFNGVDQVTALGSFASSEGDSATPSTTVSSATGELVFGVLAADHNADIDLVPGAGQTEHWDLFRDKATGGGTTEAGAVSVDTSWTLPLARKWAVGGVSIKPSQLLVVDTTNDVVDGNVNSIGDLQSSKGADGFISLREAIIATNNTAGADTISLAAGTYTLTITGVLEDLAATGDLDILGDLSIIGADAATTIIDGNGIDRVFHLGGFVVSLEGVTIASGDATVGGATDVGGGLLDAKTTQLNLDRVIFTGNHGGDGGAAQFNGTVAGSDLVFDSNTAGTFGGAFRNQGNVTFERVTFSGNSADEGGAVENRGNLTSLTLTNATFSGNSATVGNGGALFNSSIATLQNVTIAGNTATTSGGGIWNKTGNTVNLSNSLVADNLVGVSTPDDLEGAFVSSGNNLVETPGTATGLTGTDIIGIDPLLGTLADNGGFTQTMALQSGSAAINAGTAAGAPTEDQRGISRDIAPDIGAFELVTNNPVLDLDADDSSGSTGSDFSATFTDGGGPVAAVDSDATLTDANDTDLQSLTVTITDRQDGVDEILAADTSGTSIVASFSAGVLTLSGTDTVEKYQQVLRTITYGNGQAPATGASRTITFVASDGSSTSNIGTTNLSVIAASNTAPIANAGGPYVINEGDSLNLDASASSDPDTDPLTYAWDLDNDLVYGEAGEPMTVSPTVSWATLQSFGITGEGSFTIGLQVDDGNGGTDTTTASLTVYAEQLVNTTTANVQQKSDVATDATGNYVVVWQDDALDGDGTGVFAQRYDSAGATVGSEFRVNTTTVGNQSDPRVAMDDAGNFVVTWSSEGQDGDFASETNIYARVYGASGTALTGELLVNETTLDNQATPAIAMDAPTGGFMITWAGFDPVAGDWNIFARRFGALGIPLTSEFMVNTTTIGDQVDPDVSVDVIAEFAVVWTGYGQDGDLTTEANIYGQYYRANGTAFGGENLINTTTGGHQHSAAIALEDDGDCTIVWVSEGQDGDGAGIYGEQIAYGGGGNNRLGEFLVTSTTAGDQTKPDISSEPTGDFVTVWQSTGQDGDGPSETNIYTRSFTVTNSTITPKANEARVHSFAAGNQQLAAVAADAEGDFVVAWDGAGDADSDGVYSRLYQNVLLNSGPDITLANSNLSYTENDPPVVIDPALSITDADDLNLAGATVSFREGFTIGEDVLTFAAVVGISGNYDGTTGILTFTGSAPIADYETVLRSVAYSNTSEHPATIQRKLEFSASDGVSSSSDFRNVNVSTGNDDPPVVTPGQTFNVSEAAANGTSVGTVSGSDPESGTLQNWTITGGDPAGVFAIDGTSGQITIADNSTLDFESAPGSYALTITVSDGTNTAAAETVTVSLTDVNEAPSVVLSQTSGTLDEDADTSSAIVLAAITINDDALGSNSLRLSGADKDTFEISAGNLQLKAGTSLNFEAQDTYIVTIEVDDPLVGSSPDDSIDFTLAINDVNEAPVITASSGNASFTEDLGPAVIDAGLTVSDPENSGLVNAEVRFDSGFVSGQDSLLFTDQSGITGSFNASTGVLTLTGSASVAAYETALQSVAFDNSSQNPNTANRVVRFTVDDGTSTTSATRVLTVTPQDDPANVVTGGPYLVDEGSSVLLDGSTSSDVDNFIVEYEWDFDYDGVTFNTDATGSTTNFSAASIDGPDTRTVALRTRSDNGVFAIGTTMVTISNVAPTANPDSGTGFMTHEDSVVVTGNVLSNDTDPGPESLTVSSLDTTGTTGQVIDRGDGTFTYDPNGQFENLATGQSSNDTFTYTVTDGVASRVATVTIVITGANDAPIAADQNVAIDENPALNALLATAAATDVDAGDSVSWGIISGNTNGAFSINNATGEIRVAKPLELNFESNPSYSLTVRATDDNGGVDTAIIAVSVNDLNEAPTANDATFGIAENSALGTSVGFAAGSDPDPADTLTWSILGGNTNGAFSLNASTGELTVASPSTVDFETIPTYTLNLQIQDAGGLTDQAVVVVNVSDVNEAPTTTGLADVAVNEDSADVIIDLKTAFSDDETPSTALSYAIVGNSNPALLSGTPIVGGNLALKFTANANGNAIVTVRATDSEGLFATAAFNVFVAPVADAPTSTPDSYLVSGEHLTVLPAGGVLANDSDPDGDAISALLVSGPASGSLVLLSNGGFTYTPDAEFTGIDAFVYEPFDGTSTGPQRTVVLNVTRVLAPPPPSAAAGPSELSESSDAASTFESDGDETAEATTGTPLSATEVADSVGSVNVNAADSEISLETTSADDDTEEKRLGEFTVAQAGVELLRDESRRLELREATSVNVKTLNAAAPDGPSNQSDKRFRDSLRFDGEDLSYLVSTEFLQELEEVEGEFEFDGTVPEWAAGTAVATTASISVGYIMWMLRGGYVLASVLSTMPVWQNIDPLPVLAALDAADDEDDDSLETMIDRASDEADGSETSSKNEANSDAERKDEAV